jgi:hypothetical protein
MSLSSAFVFRVEHTRQFGLSLTVVSFSGHFLTIFAHSSTQREIQQVFWGFWTEGGRTRRALALSKIWCLPSLGWLVSVQQTLLSCAEIHYILQSSTKYSFAHMQSLPVWEWMLLKLFLSFSRRDVLHFLILSFTSSHWACQFIVSEDA